MGFSHPVGCPIWETTCSESFLSLCVVVSRLSDVPAGDGQRVHVFHAVQLQHVHVVAVTLVPGYETHLAAAEHVLKNGLSADFIVHAQEHGDTLAASVGGMFEQLQKHRKGCDSIRNTMKCGNIILFFIQLLINFIPLIVSNRLAFRGYMAFVSGSL